MANDPSLKELKDMIKSGWPETKSHTPASIQVYWNVRDELSEIEGVILKNDRILVPSFMRKELLQRTHQGHMGIEKSKWWATDVLYWPGMNSQISDMISRCTICLEHQQQNTKEPMIPSRIPSKTWEIVATDLVHIGQIWIAMFPMMSCPGHKGLFISVVGKNKTCLDVSY